MRCKTDVTPEMIAAGFALDKAMDSPLPDEAIYFSTIYRAMHAVAPVPLVSEAEDRIAALKKERDEANRQLTYVRGMRDEYIAQLDAKDARIAELDTLLAQRLAPVPDIPKPAPDFTRDFSGDRRRMGP